MLTFQPGGLHQCMEETGSSVIYTQEMTSGWPTRLNLTLHSLVYLFFSRTATLQAITSPIFLAHHQNIDENNFYFPM